MFEGFSDRTVDFFWGVRLNNNREWMAAHKPEYEQDVLLPMRALATEVYDGMCARYPELFLQLHISRIYRDARRLGGQGPLKDHLWFSVFEQSENRSTHPEFFFEVSADHYSFGLGVWDAPAAAMARFRQSLLENPKKLTPLVKRFNEQDTFALCGADYVKSKGEISPLLRPWFQKRQLYFQCQRPYDTAVTSREIVSQLLEGFTFLMPYNQFFSVI